jgi:putative oxidoreductase
MGRNFSQHLDRHAPAVLGLFRLVYGLLFAAYGSTIVFGWPVRPAHVVGIGAWPGWYAGLIELVAGLLIATGLFTRAAAFIASGEMAVAYFWMHQPHALWPVGSPPGGNGGTPAILFCFGFFLLVFAGAGRYSIDALLAPPAERRRPLQHADPVSLSLAQDSRGE